jgi:hypothetical protein
LAYSAKCLYNGKVVIAITSLALKGGERGLARPSRWAFVDNNFNLQGDWKPNKTDRNHAQSNEFSGGSNLHG